MAMLSFVREVALKYPLLLVYNVVLLVLVNLVSVASFLSIAPIADILLHPDLEGVSEITHKVIALLSSLGLPISLYSLLGLLLAIQVLKSVLHIISRYSLFKIRAAIFTDLFAEAFREFFAARWLFFSSSSQGKVLNTFMREMGVAASAFGKIGLLLASLIQIPFYLVVPLYISWQVTLISLAASSLLVVPLFLLGKLNFRLGKENTETSNALAQVVQESLMYAKIILGFGNQHKAQSKLKHTLARNIEVSLKSETLDVATPYMYEPLGILVVVITLIQAQHFGIAFAEMAVLLWALRSTTPLVGDLAAHRNAIVRFIPSYEQIKSLRAQAKDLRQETGEREFNALSEEIKVDGVSFSYPGQEPVLIDVNCSFPKGKMVAVVGPSGAGKSTLIDLIMGFNTPQIGRVLVDGIRLNEFEINTYRQRIGYVPQESVLFNTTIRENLLWAQEGATEMAIDRACRLANALDFISELPEGYDTVVGDRGVRLSGGQCQRLALARAILREPELLILDEATSALDTHSERLIQEAIEVIAKETTIVVIAHRLSTIVNADYIYVFDKGRVTEEGKYDELVNNGKHFSDMIRLQLLDASVENG